MSPNISKINVSIKITFEKIWIKKTENFHIRSKVDPQCTKLCWCKWPVWWLRSYPKNRNI